MITKCSFSMVTASPWMKQIYENSFEKKKGIEFNIKLLLYVPKVKLVAVC